MADPTDVEDTPPALAFAPVPVQPRHDGWTAERQRRFIDTLAATGSVSQACAGVGMNARSAYRLRSRSEGAAFSQAWNQALLVAVNRLVTTAFDRATNGTVRQHWRNGELVGETVEPSDKLLMFALTRLVPCDDASSQRWNAIRRTATIAAEALEQTCTRLIDAPGADRPVPALDAPAPPASDGDARLYPDEID